MWINRAYSAVILACVLISTAFQPSLVWAERTSKIKTNEGDLFSLQSSSRDLIYQSQALKSLRYRRLSRERDAVSVSSVAGS